MSGTEHDSVELLSVTPVVPARDVAAAIAFYVDKLGFTESWRSEPGDAGGVRRGGVEIHFFQCDDPKIASWTAFRVRCSDVTAWYERCREQGIVHPNGPLRNTPWGTSEFTALDPDRVGLTFWQPLPRPDER